MTATALPTALPTARAGYGALLLLATGSVLRAVTGRPADPRATAVVRVLGVRHLAQAVVTGVRPGPAALALGAEVDVAHSASMLGVAALRRPYRRAGTVDAAVAAAFAVAGSVLARGLARQEARSPGAGPVTRLCGLRDRVADPLARWCLPAPARRAVTRAVDRPEAAPRDREPVTTP